MELSVVSSVHVVVMGVSGSGKSTLARRLRDEFGWLLAEGDEFHPRANIAKMSRGEPLTDADRWPWLTALAGWTAQQHAAGASTIVTCSALKRAYRDVLRQPVADTFFLHLTGDEHLLAARTRARAHFMPASLLRSQFEALDPLASDEAGATLDVTPTIDELTDQAAQVIRRAR